MHGTLGDPGSEGGMKEKGAKAATPYRRKAKRPTAHAITSRHRVSGDLMGPSEITSSWNFSWRAQAAQSLSVFLLITQVDDFLHRLYQACTERIKKDTSGQAHCTGQYFDYYG